MKVALVVDGLQVGGIERVAADYAKIFRELGYETTVVNLSPSLNAVEKEISNHARILRVRFPRWLAPERYGAAIIYGAWGRFVYPAAYLVLKAAGFLYKPVLKLLHRELRERYDIAVAFSGHINDLTFVADSYVSSEKKTAWLHGAEYEYNVLSPGYMVLYRKIKNLVCLSELCDAECIKFNRRNQINKVKIYNPVSVKDKAVDREKVQKLRERYGDYALMVARLDDDKDQVTAINAMRLLDSKYRLHKKLLLVGGGKNEAALKAYAEQCGMQEQVIFTGSVDDVQNYYAGAAVYVHSSPLEGLPTVLLEAMQFHLPIAATDSVPGVREILGSDCGLISPVFDAEGLACNIFRLYTEKSTAEKVAEAGEKRIRDFAPGVAKEKIASFFESLLER